MAPSQIWGHRHVKVLFSSSPHFLALGLTPGHHPALLSCHRCLCHSGLYHKKGLPSHFPPQLPGPWFLLLHLS